MRFFCLCLIFIHTLCLANEELQLKNRFQQAEAGHYFVVEQNKIYTFFHIYEKFENQLIIEEVSVPASNISKGLNWKEWFEKGAPGNSSWTMSEIDLNQGKIIHSYSFNRKGWLDTSGADHFLSHLLNLKFKEIDLNERKKIGPPPTYGKADQRPVWNPKMIMNGTVIPGVFFSAWKARWPNDGSELARKKIEIYLPQNKAMQSFPSYFPYWIEVEGKLGSGQVRLIDSGLESLSPQPPMYKMAY